MKRTSLGAAALGTALLATLATSALADNKDYEFQLVEKELKQGDAVVSVKLVDMSPDKMEAMTAPLEPVLSTEPGVYRFKTDLMMAGQWALSLGAKVQGEEGTVESKLILKATP